MDGGACRQTPEAAEAFCAYGTSRAARAADAVSSRAREPASAWHAAPAKWAGAIIHYIKQAGVYVQTINSYQTAHPGLGHAQAASKFAQDLERIMPVPGCPARGSAFPAKDTARQRDALHAFLTKYGVMQAAGRKLAPRMERQLKEADLHDMLVDDYRRSHPGLSRQDAASALLESEGRAAFWSGLLWKVDIPQRHEIRSMCKQNTHTAQPPQQAPSSGAPAPLLA
jgi:hypothetical protein